MQIIEVIAPLNWATALINDDWTRIEDDAEAERIESFISSLPGPILGSATNEGFMRAEWTNTPNELAQDFATYEVQDLS